MPQPAPSPDQEIRDALRRLVARRPSSLPSVAFLTADWDAELWARGDIYAPLVDYCNAYDDHAARWPAVLVCGQVETTDKSNTSTVYYVDLRGEQVLVYKALVVNPKKTTIHRFTWKLPGYEAVESLIKIFS